MKIVFTCMSLLVLINLNVFGQNEPLVVEAEAGTLGSDYEVLSAGDVNYIAPQTDFMNASYPADASKVASYTLNFADSGTYKLFARVRVGAEGANDDSYFYANGFGTKDPTVDSDWITCNQQAVSGYTIINDVVEGTGDAGTEVWKWVNFTDYTGYEDAITFRVELGDLLQTFQIGARENGFDIDKIAFGRAGIYYTVDNLNKGEAGSEIHPGDEPVGPPLAEGLDKFLGCGFGPDSERDFEGYWNQVTPGNGGKWGWVERTRDNMFWDDLDEAYQRAMDNDFLFKHHVLVWGSQQPSWMSELDSAEQRAELAEWMGAVAERYPGIAQVEVVNEALHAPPDANHEGNYIGALGGTGVTGYDWIIESFRMARTAFADTTMLMINEYSIMNSTENTDEYLEIIKLLMAEDTLIDAIGFQAHGFSHTAANSTYLRNIDTLASTGLPIYVTELDIDGLTDLQQVNGYMNLFPLFWEHPAIKGVTLWGFRPAMWRGDQGAYLIDEYGVERPAMLWLRAYLKDSVVLNNAIDVYTSGDVTTIDADKGMLQILVDVSPDTATIQTVHWSVSDKDVATIDKNGLLSAVSDGTVTVTGRSLELNSTLSDQIEITISGQINPVQNLTGADGILTVYPNPAREQLTIELPLTDQASSRISFYSLSGMLMKSLETNETHMQISLDNLPAGSYLLKVNTAGESYVSRIQVLK